MLILVFTHAINASFHFIVADSRYFIRVICKNKDQRHSNKAYKIKSTAGFQEKTELKRKHVHKRFFMLVCVHSKRLVSHFLGRLLFCAFPYLSRSYSLHAFFILIFCNSLRIYMYQSLNYVLNMQYLPPRNRSNIEDNYRSYTVAAPPRGQGARAPY